MVWLARVRLANEVVLDQNCPMDKPTDRIERTESELPADLAARLKDLDAVIVPGIPGMAVETLDVEGPAFPSTTTDVLKVLREQGLRVEYVDPSGPHPLISHKAADWWVPIVVFIQTGAATTVGNLLSHAIITLLGPKRAESSVLHVKVGVVHAGQDRIEWFEGHGKGADVLKALRIFRG